MDKTSTYSTTFKGEKNYIKEYLNQDSNHIELVLYQLSHPDMGQVRMFPLISFCLYLWAGTSAICRWYYFKVRVSMLAHI